MQPRRLNGSSEEADRERAVVSPVLSKGHCYAPFKDRLNGREL